MLMVYMFSCFDLVASLFEVIPPIDSSGAKSRAHIIQFLDTYLCLHSPYFYDTGLTDNREVSICDQIVPTLLSSAPAYSTPFSSDWAQAGKQHVLLEWNRSANLTPSISTPKFYML